MDDVLQDVQTLAKDTRSSAGYVVPMDDPIYRRLFGFPRMVADLLRVVGHGDWARDVELGTLEKLPAEHVGDAGQQRRGDAAWRVRFRDRWLYLLILLEFQSRNDPRMALRNLEYTALLYRELDRRGELGMPGRWPPVLPIVLYNGDAPWTAALEMRDLIAETPAAVSACQPSQRSLLLDERRVAVDDLPRRNLIRAVVGFEQAQSPTDLTRVAMALGEWLATPTDHEIGRAFADWIAQLTRRMDTGDEMPPLGGTFEETTMSLADRVAQWPEQWRREGRAEGHRERLDQERSLLQRLATLRFGGEVGERVESLLLETEDWHRLVAAGELIVTVETGSELIDRVAALSNSSRPTGGGPTAPPVPPADEPGVCPVRPRSARRPP